MTGRDQEGTASADADPESLRARLYAPDATPADRAAYEAALARASAARIDRTEPIAPMAPSAETEPPDPEPPLPVPGRRPIGRAAVAVIAAALLGIGAGIGIGATTIGAAQPAPTATPSVAPPRALPVPTPVAARSSPMQASQRKAVADTLARALATGTDGDAVGRVVEALGPALEVPRAEQAWVASHACSTSTGVVRASSRGRPMVLTSADGALRVPAHSHFRISILMTRPASWSWTLFSGGADRPRVPIALGAGSPEAGTAQFADFDGAGAGDLTRVEVTTGSSTPFLWQLESCVSG